MQEPALAGLEHLGTVGAVAMGADVPRLVLEELRIGRERRQEPGESAHVAQADDAVLARLRREVRVGPQRVVVVVARHHRERQLAGKQAEAGGGAGNLEATHLGVGLAGHAGAGRVGDPLETAGLVLGVHPFRVVLPDVAHVGGEDDVTAVAAGVVADVAHLLVVQLHRVDRKALGLLPGEVHVVLGVGDHRHGEGAALAGLVGRGLRPRLDGAGKGGGQRCAGQGRQHGHAEGEASGREGHGVVRIQGGTGAGPVQSGPAGLPSGGQKRARMPTVPLRPPWM